MYSSLKTLIVLIVLSLAASGCGDLLGTKVTKRAIGEGIAEVGCELDLDRFSEILHDNISQEIRCLGANLDLFIKVVKSGKPGYLSRVQLERYLATHRPDVKPEVIRALKAVFDLGHLITGDDPNYISKSTVDKVISFALIFNEQAALNFRPTFQNESEVSYTLHQNHRDRVSTANKAIIQSLRDIFKRGDGEKPRKLNIIELLESFSTDSTEDVIEKAKRVLFLKKVLLGGENEIITNEEIQRLLLNFDYLTLIALDVVRYKYIKLDQPDILHLVKVNVDHLYNVVNHSSLGNRDTELYFTIDEAISAAKLFMENSDIDVEKYKDLIVEAKKIVMKGNGTEVRGAELNNLFADAKTLLQTGNIFHRIWDKFKAQLLSSRPVEETIDFDEYRHTYPQHQTELDQFERITKKYRFMKGEFKSSYYQKGFKRNAAAIFEIALFEYALKKVFETYGRPSPNTDSVGGYSIDQDQMQKLVKKFEDVLIDLELLTPQRAIGTADNISLLGTLFQYQSDKNGYLDVNEGTEFAVSLFSALSMSEDMHKFFQDKKCEFDEYDRTSPECFKANFWPALCKHYEQYFPLMFQSFNVPKACKGDGSIGPDGRLSWVSSELDVFLDKAISAARSCNFYTDGDKEEIPYSKGDIMTIMLAIMHAETTVLRWDTDGDNIMNADEVERSYEIYSPALDGFLEEKSPIIRALKKQIFQYMIKYESIPDEKNFSSIWKFVKFLLSFNKKAPATRKTIVSLLDAVGKENAKIAEGPVFDCNLMRYPDRIPREPETKKSSVARMSALGIAENELDTVLPETTGMMKEFNAEEKEMLKDQLYLFTDDMAQGRISKVKSVKQKELKYVFTAIAKDSSKMREIRSVVKEGNDLHKIALTVSALLIDEKTK